MECNRAPIPERRLSYWQKRRFVRAQGTGPLFYNSAGGLVHG